MKEALEVIATSPLPTILGIGGIFFLFLALVGKVGGSKLIIDIPLERQKGFAIAGTVLLLVGALLYIIPPVLARPTPEPTHTPTPTTTPTYTPTATPIVSSSVLFQEDFEGDIKLQPRDEQYWQVVTDDKTGNHYYCVDPPQEDYTHASAGWLTGPNYTVEVDVLILESSTGSGNLSVRATRDSAYVYDFTEKEMVLTKEVYGDFAKTRLDGPSRGLIVSKWYTIRFEVRNSDISVSVDGTQVFHAEDSDVERGGVALGAGWGLGVCFDNVRVMELESSG